jgi:hypothetical protein
MKRKSLIITPTATNIYFSDEYDKQNHWRFRKPEATYDICVVVYKDDFEPEPGTYDMIIRKKGLKFKLIPEICKMIKWEDYDYIGTWDDDYATDIQSVNHALALARKFDFRLFQQAAISYNFYDCLKHNSEFVFTETNFIETGVPFFRNDIFRRFLDFLNDYNYKVSEWGIDKVMCHLLQCTAHVVHDSTVKHMRTESWYDKTIAHQEMDFLMHVFFPKYMKEKFGIDYTYNDQQVTYAGLKKSN